PSSSRIRPSAPPSKSRSSAASLTSAPSSSRTRRKMQTSSPISARSTRSASLPRSPASSPSRAAAIPAEPRRARTAKMPKKRRASLPSFTRTAASASTNSSLPPVRPSLRPHQAPRAPAQPI
ncbi:hypothetical protein PSTG_20013, partial [Puccinia striiformis f. sp. tritici PST-78]